MNRWFVILHLCPTSSHCYSCFRRSCYHGCNNKWWKQTYARKSFIVNTAIEFVNSNPLVSWLIFRTWFASYYPVVLVQNSYCTLFLSFRSKDELGIDFPFKLYVTFLFVTNKVFRLEKELLMTCHTDGFWKSQTCLMSYDFSEELQVNSF